MRRSTIVVLVAVASLLVGCSDDQSAAPTTTSAPMTLVPTTTSTTVVAAEEVAASDERGLADQLARVETIIRDPASSSADRAVAARLQQRVYRRLVERSELRLPTLSLVNRLVRVIAEPILRAGVELHGLTKPRTSFPDWKIVEPAPADELLAHYRAAEKATGVGWQYLAAIHLVETRMGRIRGTSSAGAQGPMQFMPATWERYGEGGDINDNGDAIHAAARLLKANGFPSRIDDALRRYNNAQAYVIAVKAYAQSMAEDELTYSAYYEWQVFYRMTTGTVILKVGYPEVQPEPL